MALLNIFRKKRVEEQAPPMPPEVEQKLRTQYYNEGSAAVKEQESEDDVLGIVDRLSASLIKKRDIAVTARASCGIERIWREDELAFEGYDEAGIRSRMIDYATQRAPAKTSRREPRRSKVVINIVRPKCETAEGRYSDIQLPTDDKNWGLMVTPVPELVKQMKDTQRVSDKETGNPLYKSPDGRISDEEAEGYERATIGDIARSEMEEAKKKMTAMEAEIDDQLTECEFNGECRKVIRDAVRIGTGVLKGPIVVKDLKKSWRRVEGTDSRGDTVVVRVLEMIEDLKPSSRRVDPWDVFPDPECREDIRKAAYIWERETVTPRQLRDLIGVGGYMDDQILKVLQEEPSRVTVAEDKDNHFLVRYNHLNRGNSYEKWEYNGDLDKDDLDALGVDISDVRTLGQSVGACVVMVNDRPIKVMLNPLDTGELPYDFFPWTERAGVPWGTGVARQLMWPQRVLIAAWRAMMDNAGDSSGANIIVAEGVEPMDGYWEIGGKKLWRATGDQQDMKKAFMQWQIENNQEDLQRIIELVLRFADIESGLPMLFSGEKGDLPETLGATNIIVDSNNVALRSRVKLWDDNITRPHIGRYYDWNMQYNPKEEIKGDYKVDARGISILLARDMEAQNLIDLLELRKDAELSVMIDWPKAIKQLTAARNLDVLLPKEKIEEALERLRRQPPTADKTVEAARIRTEGELAKAELTQEADMAELEFKAQAEELKRQHDLRIKAIELEMKELETMVNAGIEQHKIKAKLAEVAQKLKTQVDLAKEKDVKPAEQVANPVAEPAGRAKEGYAFQQ